MPRARKGDKFGLHSKARNGDRKGKYILAVRATDANLQDLIDFLGRHDISPSQVEMPIGFVTSVG